MEEIWKDIEGFEGLYQVNNLGRIKALKKLSKGNGRNQSKLIWRKERLLKPNISGFYFMVKLSKNEESKSFTLHRLIAQSFLGDHPGMNVDHKDNNQLNNNIENLQWITSRENATKDKKGSSKYSGVCLHKTTKKWEAYVMHNSIKKYLGIFDTEEKASERYKYALIEFGIENNFAAVV